MHRAAATLRAGIGEVISPDEAREQARDILRQRRYRAEKVPRPFEGVLRWLGDRLEPVARIFDPVVDLLTSRVGAVIGLLVVVAAVAYLALSIAKRRSARPSGSPTRGTASSTRLDPIALEREADAAERSGDLERALRLRFRAGLLRLDRTGAIRFHASLTSGQVSRALDLRAFDDLARTFDAVAYGGATVEPDDVLAAKQEWPRVVAEVG